VGEKNCVIDGNAIGLRWPSIVVERAKKNNERRAGANSNSEFSRAKKMCGFRQAHETRISSLFAGNLLHVRSSSKLVSQAHNFGAPHCLT
jgi:hypothetical protein